MGTENHPFGGESLPQVNFSTFVLSLASSTLVQLGDVPNPETNSLTPNMAMAEHSIAILEMLQQKTIGNLNDEETRLINGVLYEVHMKYLVKKQ